MQLFKIEFLLLKIIKNKVMEELGNIKILLVSNEIPEFKPSKSFDRKLAIFTIDQDKQKDKSQE
jgi:hypothetical protein